MSADAKREQKIVIGIAALIAGIYGVTTSVTGKKSLADAATTTLIAAAVGAAGAWAGYQIVWGMKFKK